MLGQLTISKENRDLLLKDIADARAIAKELDARAAALPSWALASSGPMGQDWMKYQNALQTRRDRDVDVSAIERRLSAGGPVWPALTDAETKALAQWTGAIDVQASILGKYFPSEVQKDIQKYSLLVIGLGAMFSPLIFTESAVPSVPRPPMFAPRPRPAPVSQIPMRSFAERRAIDVPYTIRREALRPSTAPVPAAPAEAPGEPVRVSEHVFRSPFARAARPGPRPVFGGQP